MLGALVRLLRPAGWPAVPHGLRSRLRLLALGAVVTQVVFVAAWLVAGAIEPGYSATDSFVSELGAGDAARPWLVNGAIVVWSAGFACVAAGLTIVLRGRPWRHFAPALFAAAAVVGAASGLMTLDCTASADAACDARQQAGDLSWHHYGHNWAALALGILLTLTPFALAMAERPSLLSKVTFAAGLAGVVLWLLSVLGNDDEGGAGIFQRLALAVVNYWVILIAATLLVEASGRWSPSPGSGPRP